MVRFAPPCIAAVGLALLLSGCEEESEDPPEQVSNLRQIQGLGQPLVFSAACADGDRLTIAAVGDVLLHGRLQTQAYASEVGFRSLWESTSELLQGADIAYANLEGPTAPGVNKSGKAVPDPGMVFDDNVYSSYPQFNYHPSLIDDLLETGVDVVSTANNHSLDRKSLGADRTIDELRARGLAFTGTRRSDEPDGGWHTVTDTAGFRLAWLACTYGTNGIADPNHQVLGCFSDKSEVLNLIETLAQASDIDAVIVTPHWGTEYQSFPEDKVIDLGREMLDTGATVILGSHPHVLQPWEKHVTPDGRETFAIYSLGNFVSGQRQLARRSTLLLQLGLTRISDGTVQVSGARYVPLNMGSAQTMSLELLDRDGGDMQSRAATVDMFGLWNVASPVAPIQPAPQCDPDWQSPHPLDGWIGGRCEDDNVCGGTSCSSAFVAGMCTLPCDGLCPDAAGRTGTFCTAAPDGISGVCSAQCASDDDCRPGYSCLAAPRFGQPAGMADVCLPTP